MEAISFGIPVFATDVGGTAEIISDSFGRLLPKDISHIELACEIESLIKKDEDEKREMRKHAIKFWEENYDADINYKKFADFLITV
jgi:glycosyltransferase involved in cell wall biosynthesis